MSMKKVGQNLNFIIGAIGMEVLLGKSVTPIVSKVIQRKFLLH